MKTGSVFETPMVRYREHVKYLAPIPDIPRLRTVDLRPEKKAWLSRSRGIMAVVVLLLTTGAGAWGWSIYSMALKADQELKAANKESAERYGHQWGTRMVDH